MIYYAGITRVTKKTVTLDIAESKDSLAPDLKQYLGRFELPCARTIDDVKKHIKLRVRIFGEPLLENTEITNVRFV